MWNPDLYLRFADERGRPFRELVARIAADEPRVVLDLGCGPGNLTESLVQRWPNATVTGVDSSAEMVAKAKESTSGVSYQVADIRDYEPADEVDVIVTNATLQWIPGHDELLKSWVKPGRWIAMQVPGNQDASGHVALRELCDAPRWSEQLGGIYRVKPVGDAVHYGRLLRAAGCEVDAWETNYIHQLPVAQTHPVLTWMSGTAMRPIRARLNDADWEAFCADFEAELVDRYPATGGIVDFPFLRVFAVAQCNRHVALARGV